MKLPRHLKVAAGSAGTMLFGILFGWVIFPTLLKSGLKKEMALTEKTDVRGMWAKIPFGLDFKIYLFNYTNPEEVQKGGVPIVKEVGPYYFEEWKEKVEMKDFEENDTISYKRLDKFYFKKELSGPGLTGEEIITMPNMFILAMVIVVSREKPAMINMMGKAFNGIFDNPSDIFMRVRALDILFDGMNINCARTEFAPKAVCTAIKKEAPSGLVIGENNQFKFSIFGGRNATVDKHILTVKRGSKNIMDVGKVVAFDGQTKQEIWKDHCNNIEGTDGTIFPPFLTENDRLESFATDLCRSFKPWFQKKTSYMGIPTNRYIANIGDLNTDPSLQCYCDAPDTCPLKGLMDLTKCIKAPMIASMPHYLESDPSLLRTCKGLSPDPDAHSIVIDFEPITGTPLVARQRLQFNINLMKTEKLQLFKELPNTVAPLFWVEEGLALDKDFIKMLKHQLFLPKKIVGVIRWLLVAFGGLGLVGSLLFHYKDNILSFAVTPGSAKAVKVNPEEQKDVSVIGQAPAEEPTKINM